MSKMRIKKSKMDYTSKLVSMGLLWCDYTGPIIEGNDEMAEEIRESYLESIKEE